MNEKNNGSNERKETMDQRNEKNNGSKERKKQWIKGKEEQWIKGMKRTMDQRINERKKQ